MVISSAFCDDAIADNTENIEFPFWMKTNIQNPAMAFNAQGVWYVDWGGPDLQTQIFPKCNLDEQADMPNGYKN